MPASQVPAFFCVAEVVITNNNSIISANSGKFEAYGLLDSRKINHRAMNGKLWMLLVAFTGTYGIVNAKVWRVNNNPGTSADFIQLTTAVASSSVVAGDTLYVEGGSAAYTGINLSKRLVIIGAGY